MSVKQVSGSCAAGAALSTCQSSLYGGGSSALTNNSKAPSSAAANITSSGSGQSSSRILVSLMAGTSTDDVKGSATALKEMSVRT